MTKLCLVSFHIHDETYTESFSKLANELNHHFNELEVVLIVDKINNKKKLNIPIKQIEMPKTTKYKRILSLLDRSNSDYFLFVDNDIDSDITKTIQFIKETIKRNADIAWGKIMAQKNKGLTSKMVAVDKLLSHNIIRPALWMMNVGVTVPGQCFIIKAKSFKDKIDTFDTFLDDISFGLHVQLNKMKVYIDSNVLGYEEPDIKLGNLFKQRKRWSHGFSSILFSNRKHKKATFLLYAHAFSYHLSWMLLWLATILIGTKSVALALGFLALSFLFICRRNINLIPATFCYFIIFPLLHLYWLFYAIKYYQNFGGCINESK